MNPGQEPASASQLPAGTKREEGSGPVQLALAPLADHLGDDDVAQPLYQEAQWTVTSRYPW